MTNQDARKLMNRIEELGFKVHVEQSDWAKDEFGVWISAEEWTGNEVPGDYWSEDEPMWVNPRLAKIANSIDGYVDWVDPGTLSIW